MKTISKNNKGFTLIEVIIILAILLIIARYVFALQLYEWENSMWRSVGVQPELARFIAGIFFFSFLIWRAIAERKSRKRNRFIK
jgi:prepilin-type N-terminal cleavage/methylation domain-containing protein